MPSLRPLSSTDHPVTMYSSSRSRPQIQRTTRQVTMYSLRLLSVTQDPTNQPPSHNVFFTTVRVVSKSDRPPTKSQCIPCNGSHRLQIQWTTRQVTMYSLRLLSVTQDTTNQPPSHNVFFTTTRVVSKSDRPPTKSQCIPCNGSHRLQIQWTTRQVTMYSLRLLSVTQDPTNQPPSHNVFFTTARVVSRSDRPPTKSQCIPCNDSHCLQIQRTTRQVTMYSLRLLSVTQDPTDHPLSHNVSLAVTLTVSISQSPTRQQWIPHTSDRQPSCNTLFALSTASKYNKLSTQSQCVPCRHSPRPTFRPTTDSLQISFMLRTSRRGYDQPAVHQTATDTPPTLTLTISRSDQPLIRPPVAVRTRLLSAEFKLSLTFFLSSPPPSIIRSSSTTRSVGQRERVGRAPYNNLYRFNRMETIPDVN